jgi:hypothetical protein
LSEYRAQANFPNPWPGGTWRLRDIVEYDLSAVRGLIEGAARYRRELLENFDALGRRAVQRGRAGAPYAFVVPSAQHDPIAAKALIDALLGGAVEVHQAVQPFRADGREYPAGSLLILMAQPYRAFAKTLLERQDYPARRVAPGGGPERPYDVTGWTLPYQMGVAVETIDQPFELPALSRITSAPVSQGLLAVDPRPTFYIVDARGNAGAQAIGRLQATGVPVRWTMTPVDLKGMRFNPGAVVVPSTRKTREVVERISRELGLNAAGVRGAMPLPLAPVARPRIGLYKSWVENIDEGWTRWVLERYGFSFVSLTDADMRAGDLGKRVDVIILPDAPPERMVAGHTPGTMPEQYVGGLGETGVAALQAFVDDGGTLVCLDSACGLAIDALALPLRDTVRSVPPERFFCPGSILRLRVDPASPLAFGLPAETAAFFATSSAYELLATHERDTATAINDTSARSRVIATYGEQDTLLSGWLDGGDLIAGKGALVESHVGRGRVIAFGFRVQHRAQTLATFRLLFNTFYTHGSELRLTTSNQRRQHTNNAKH